jgi:hypothetical protein
MKAKLGVGLLFVALICLAGSAPLAREDTRVARLASMARERLGAQMHVQAQEIQVLGVETWTFPYRAAGASEGQPDEAGYVIRLAAGGQVYEYKAKVAGDLYVLWREV